MGLDPKSIVANITRRKELNKAIKEAKEFYFNDVTKRLNSNEALDLVNNPNNFKRIKFGYNYKNDKGGTVINNFLWRRNGILY